MSERIERMLTTRQLSAFLKSDQAEAAPSEKTARETTDAVGRTENAIRETTARTEDAIQKTTDAAERTANAIRETTARTEGAIKETTDAIRFTQDVLQDTQDEILQQGQKLTSFTLVTTAFLPLGFATSVFYLLSMI